MEKFLTVFDTGTKVLNIIHHTFLFELTTRENRVVKPYSEDNLYLIGIRNNETGEYTSYDNLCLVSMLFKVPVPEKYSLKGDQTPMAISIMPLFSPRFSNRFPF